MRLPIGREVILFDGSGRECSARIVATGRDWVEADVESTRIVDRELIHGLTIAIPLPKGDRQRFLVEKLVELGATKLVGLNASRSVAIWNEVNLERARRYVVEASKQCGRNRLMEIAGPWSCPEYFAAVTCPVRCVADSSGLPVSRVEWSGPATIAVGPEGGFSLEELDAAKDRGWQSVCLGKRALRMETAALCAAAIAASRLER
jgi:16S rRNA (uracil1498-N3)-methyltransferase